MSVYDIICSMFVTAPVGLLAMWRRASHQGATGRAAKTVAADVRDWRLVAITRKAGKQAWSGIDHEPNVDLWV